MPRTYISRAFLNADAIEELRSVKGLSLNDLALSADLHPRTLQRKLQENGKANFGTIKKLGETLGVTDLSRIIRPPIEVAPAQSPPPIPVAPKSEDVVWVYLPLPKGLFKKPEHLAAFMLKLSEVLDLHGVLTSGAITDGSARIQLNFSDPLDIERLVVRFCNFELTWLAIQQLDLYFTVDVDKALLSDQLRYPPRQYAGVIDDSRLGRIEVFPPNRQFQHWRVKFIRPPLWPAQLPTAIASRHYFTAVLKDALPFDDAEEEAI